MFTRITRFLLLLLFPSLLVIYLQPVAATTSSVVNTVVFSEDWESGIDTNIWKVYGSPQPSIYSGEGVNGSDALDANGDGSYDSGLIAYDPIDISNGVSLEYWLRGSGNTGAVWQGSMVGFATCTPSDNNETCRDYVAWINPTAEANVVTYSSKYGSTTETFAPLDGQWHKYGIDIHADGFIDFYRDDVLKFSTTTPIDFNTYNTTYLDVRGRSYNSYYYVDDILVEESNAAIIEEFDSSTGFTQTDPDVYIADGKVHWTVYRNGGEQFVYRDIPAFTGDVRLTVTGQVDSANNNCHVRAGIGDGPGAGTAARFGYYGGGCPTNGYVITALGASLDYYENSCNFTGNWLWINDGTEYTAVLTLENGAASLVAHDVGTASGTPTYTGAYNTLYVGLNGIGDTPSCSGSIERMVIEPLSEENNAPNMPANPAPSTGATDVTITTDLSWTGGDPDSVDTVTYDVYFGTTNPPPLVSDNQAASTYDPGTLANNAQYYWKIVAEDNHSATTEGPVWDFTTENTPPNVPSSPSPADNVSDVSVTTNLSWTGGDPDSGDSVTYDVYFGTTNPPPLVSEDQAATTYDPGVLTNNTQYYWKIVAEDNHSVTTEGPVWDFTTENNPPNIPSAPSPADNASDVSVTTDLSWTGGDPDSGDSVTYDVYFGTTNPPPLVSENQSATTYDPGVLANNTQYYWKIVAEDNHAAATEGPVWDFTTVSGNNPPYEPSAPSPADNASNVPVTTDLSWTGGDPDSGDTVTYDVYFGTTNPPPLVSEDQSATTYDPSTLNYEAQYYWKIVAEDNHTATTDGSVWNFVTGSDTGGPHFTDCESGTGNNATVMVPNTVTIISPTGLSLEAGDEIAVFTPDGALCTGVNTWDGNNLAITVWGNDSQTPEKDGMDPGDEIRFHIWDQSEGIEYTIVELTYSSGDGLYASDSFQVVASIEVGSSHFTECAENTGNNATVLVPADISVLGEIPLEVGDEIAVFRPDGSLCAGSIRWQGNNIAITVWGDDSQTSEIDGMVSGEVMHYYVWDASAEVEYPDVEVTYRLGDGIYVPDSFHILDTIDLDPIVIHDILLSSGWNMISSYVEPENPDMYVVFSDIITDVVLVKNGAGEVFWPEYFINDIGNWDVKDGYQVYMLSEATLSITGAKLDPTVMPIDLLSGWSLVGYLRDTPMQIDQALGTINGEILLAKNNVGQVYWPEYFINDIGSMQAGQGYQVYLTASATLTYPGD